MGAFLDALEATPKTTPGRPCATCAALDSMDVGMRLEVEAAIDAGEESSSRISKVLRGLGYNVSEGSLRRHRRDECIPQRSERRE